MEAEKNKHLAWQPWAPALSTNSAHLKLGSTVPEKVGTTRLTLPSGLSLSLNHHANDEKGLCLPYFVENGPVCFWFCLSGRGCNKLQGRMGKDCRFDATPDQCVVSWAGNVRGVLEGMPGTDFTTLSLHVPFQWLARFSDHMDPGVSRMIFNPNPGRIGKTHSLSPACRATLHQLVYPPALGKIGQLFLDAKAMELMALVLGEIGCYKSSEKDLFRADVDRIYEARHLLYANMGEPLTLRDLAGRVGINEFKLKKGFRRVFGTTVFGCLHAHRMEMARELLVEGRANVSEAAGHVGYTNVSHFITAYRKRFGINPGRETRSTTGAGII